MIKNKQSNNFYKFINIFTLHTIIVIILILISTSFRHLNMLIFWEYFSGGWWEYNYVNHDKKIWYEFISRYTFIF